MFGKKKRLFTEAAVAIENTFRPHFVMTEYLDKGEFNPPSGFYRDPYILSFVVNLANFFRVSLLKGKNWSDAKKGDYIIFILNYLDKDMKDNIVADFGQFLIENRFHPETVRGSDDAGSLFGAMFGLLPEDDDNIIVVEARKLADDFQTNIEQTNQLIGEPNVGKNVGLMAAIDHLTIKKHIHENYLNEHG